MFLEIQAGENALDLFGGGGREEARHVEADRACELVASPLSINVLNTSQRGVVTTKRVDSRSKFRETSTR